MIITNNNSVYEILKNEYDVVLIEGTYKDVLVMVRNKIHEGYELLTHPLSSSLKPDETPYKSVIISDNKGELNFESVYIIENSIMVFEKFKNNKFKCMTEQMREDFKLIDLAVLKSALNI